MSRRLFFILVMSLCLAWSATSFAQSSTVGGLAGTITDDSGGALPGVTLELSGPAMQGTRTATSDSAGKYRFLNVPAGDNYRVTATLSGFQSITKSGIHVYLGQEGNVNFSLKAAVAESITVSAEAPLVDVSKTTTGVNVTSKQFESLPTQRSFQQLTAMAPGVDMSMANSRGNALENSPAVGASSAPENNYIIDGLSTTDMKYGTSGTNLTMNFVEEVQVMTGGYPAEYGRSTGGVFNVVTKSGGNEFHGDVFGYYQNADWSSNAVRDRYKTTTTLSTNSTNKDIGASLGGRIVRDRLWFFAAYDPTRRTDYRGGVTDTGGGVSVPNASRTVDRKTDFYAGKLTGSLNANHTLVLSAFGDPRTREGYLTQALQDPGTQAKVDEGSKNINLRYNGIISSTWLVEGNVGQAKQKTDQKPLNEIGRTIPRQIDEATQYWYGGIMRNSLEEATRKSYSVKSSNFLGTHELRYGLDMEKNEFDSAIHERWYRWYGQTAPLDLCELSTGDNCWQMRRQTYDLNGSGTTDNQAAFLQDSWKVLPNLQVNAGIRYETQKLTSANGVIVGIDEQHIKELKLDNNWAPRLGIVFDPMNNGRSKVYGFVGRYFEAIPLDLNLRAINGENYRFERFYTSDPITGLNWMNPTGDPLALHNYTQYRDSTVGSYTPLDPNLKAQYQDEWVVGTDYQFASVWSAGVRYVDRELKRVIEDFGVFTNPNDPLELTGYIIGNPGEGTFGAPFEKPKRKYQALEFTATRAYANNWQLNTSFVYARAKGNYEGLYLSGYEQLDPNITAYYDIPSMLVNAYGRLRADKPYQLKVYGSYSLPFGLTLSEGFQFSAGIPIDMRGPEIYNGYSDGNIFFKPRGSAGRTPNFWNLDLHADYHLPFLKGEGRNMALIVDAFNVFNNHEVLEVDTDYIYEAMDPAILNQWEDPSNLDAAGNPVYNPNLPHSAYYKTPTLYQAPRSVQVGIKYTY